MNQRWDQAGGCLIWGVFLGMVIGCGRDEAPVVEPTPTSVRAERRAYAGAPPTIPHPILGGACVNCHTESDRILPGVGIAPANPHTKTPGIGLNANCRQCHVFSNTETLFVVNDFEGLSPAVLRSGERSHLESPPTVPHPLQMREDCRACHTGPAARPEILCDHPDRLNCIQCHVPRRTSVERPPGLTELGVHSPGS